MFGWTVEALGTVLSQYNVREMDKSNMFHQAVLFFRVSAVRKTEEEREATAGDDQSAAPAMRRFISFVLKLPEGARSSASFLGGEEKLHWHSEDSPNGDGTAQWAQSLWSGTVIKMGWAVWEVAAE
jgi:hypothetical protein